MSYRKHLTLVAVGCTLLVLAISSINCGRQSQERRNANVEPSPGTNGDDKSLAQVDLGAQHLTAQETEDLNKFKAEELLKEIRSREKSAHIVSALNTSPIHSSIEVGTSAASDVELNPALSKFASDKLVIAVLDQQKALYGEDNRKDVFLVASNPQFAKSADAVVSLFKRSDIVKLDDGQNSKIVRKDYGTEFNLCSSGSNVEAFLNQPCSAYCSGVLVAPDLIVTAGHCVFSPEKPAPVLGDIYFVFGYRMRDPDTAELVIKDEEIYSGKEVVKQIYSASGQDFALIRLDRVVIGHRPVPIRRTGKISNHEDVYVIGHPCGLPAKFADGAVVRENGDPNFFVANLDTYGGNSGSPVFNRTSHELEGILVRGERDFVKRDPSSSTSCRISLRCPDTDCRGEDCTRVTLFSSLIPNTP